MNPPGLISNCSRITLFFFAVRVECACFECGIHAIWLARERNFRSLYQTRYFVKHQTELQWLWHWNACIKYQLPNIHTAQSIRIKRFYCNVSDDFFVLQFKSKVKMDYVFFRWGEKGVELIESHGKKRVKKAQQINRCWMTWANWGK